VSKQPQDKLRCGVSGQIVQNEQHPQGRQLLRQRRIERQTRLPSLPAKPDTFRARWGFWQRRQRLHDLAQLLLEPAMQHWIGAGGDATHTYLSVRRVKQRQDLGGAVANVFVRLSGRLAFGFPGDPGIGNGLERACLIGTPDRQTQLLAQQISVLD